MSDTAPNSSSDRTPMDRRAAAAKARASSRSAGKQRSALTNGKKLLMGVDGRSPWLRRLRDLLSIHTNDLGGPDAISEGEKSIVRRIATITAELELLESRFAIAETGAKAEDLDLYFRGANNLRRLLEAVGLQRRSRDITPPDPLAYARALTIDVSNAGIEDAEIIDAEPVDDRNVRSTEDAPVAIGTVPIAEDAP